MPNGTYGGVRGRRNSALLDYGIAIPLKITDKSAPAAAKALFGERLFIKKGDGNNWNKMFCLMC